MKACEAFEGQSQSKNFRIYAVLEKLEGSHVTGFVEN